RRPGPPPTPRHGTPGHPPARPHSRLTPAHKGRGDPRTARQRTYTLARPARPTSWGRGEPRTAPLRTRTPAHPAGEADLKGGAGNCAHPPQHPRTLPRPTDRPTNRPTDGVSPSLRPVEIHRTVGPQLAQPMLGVDPPHRPRLGPHHDRVGGRRLRPVANPPQQLPVGDAG